MTRLERLRAYLVEHKLAGAVLTQAHHVAAVLQGAQLYNGDRPEPPGRAAVCVTADRIHVLGNATEVARVCGEELAGFGPEAIASPWQTWSMQPAIESWWANRGGLRADSFGEGAGQLCDFLDSIAYPLDSHEIAKITALGVDVAEILVATAQALRVGMTECGVKARMVGELLTRGANPDLVFVSFDERIAQYRHARPGSTQLQARALLSITACRHGLYVSATRLVELQVVSPDLDADQRAANQIEAAAVAHVASGLANPPAAGIAARAVYATIAATYAEQGDAAGVDQHHVGGPSGFRGRDAKVHAGSHATIRVGQPFVFNPVFGGGKSEDTWIVDPDSGTLNCLTDTPSWPVNQIEIGSRSFARPGIWRPAVQRALHVGVIGLGRIGQGAAGRLVQAGVRVVGFDPSAVQLPPGVQRVDSIAALVAALPAPRVILVWVPAQAVEDVLLGDNGLAQHCQANDIIVESGNTHAADAVRRASLLDAHGLRFVDAATSGGIGGAQQGYCMVVGASESDYAALEPILACLTAPGACTRVGPVGAASFVKAVHNGIEYGMLAAVAEGMALLAASPAGFELEPGALAAFRRASIIESRILDWFCEAAAGNYRELAAHVGGGETGRWCLEAALEAGVSMPVLSAALAARFASQGGDDTAARLLAQVRRLFGGHAVREGV